MASFETWTKECLKIGAGKIIGRDNKSFPDFNVQLQLPVPHPELSEDSSSDFEDEDRNATPGKKKKSPAYATPLKSPSKIPVSVRTPQPAPVHTSSKSTRVRTTSGNRGTAAKVANVVPPSTGRAQRSATRLKQPSSATKPLTDSAIKRKAELDKQRALLLQQQMKEKEEKAARQREQNLATMVVEHKQKREEKERKVAMTRDQLEKEANERRLRESAKKKEADRRRREIEESRKMLQKRPDENTEAERRAAEAAAAAARRAVEEERAKREQEAVAKQIRDRIQQIQQQKQANLSSSMSLSTSLAHKMMATSFVSQTQLPSTAPAAHTSLISEIGDSQVDASNNAPVKAAVTETALSNVASAAATASNQIINLSVTVNGNATFSVPPASKGNDSMLPPQLPPPAPKLVSYDISDLNSDAESDDERNPRKVIPDWAKGSNFVEALQAQYSKLRKYRERDVMKTFRLCPTTVDLDEVFKEYTRPVIPKYDKRTSSAHWSSPPASKLNFSDSFWANASFSKSILEQKE